MSFHLGGKIFLGATLCLPIALSLAIAQESTPAPVSPEPQVMLSAEALKNAIKTDSITIPTPGELFEAFSNVSTPNWASQFRPPIPIAFSKRYQIALNVGGLITDGYLAVEAMDSQQVKNVGKDIISLAKGLAVSEQVLSRGNSITEFAENNEWMALKEELEGTQDEVKLAMEEMRDQDLVTLVSLGGWIRGTQAVSGLLLKDYSPEVASIIRQPELVGYLHGKMKTLSPKIAEEPLVKSIDLALTEIKTILKTPDGASPTKAQVKEIHDKTSALITAISTK